MRDLDGRVAVVTGAASGIRLALASTVAEAIRSEQFWITTTAGFAAAVRDRNESLMRRVNPSTTRTL